MLIQGMSDARHAELTLSGLNLIQQAISIFDAELRLAVDIRSPQEIETAVATNQMDLGMGYFANPLKNLRYQPMLDGFERFIARWQARAAR